MKFRAIVVIWLILFHISVSKAIAIVDPFAVPNNKYGIHVIDENDLSDAADLVNSSGGDWGYVTIVINDKDRNFEQWQKTFSFMTYKHLIPIIRLATHLEGDAWAKPKIGDIKSWVDFLSKLAWPIRNRYIILFNEPNHAKEWGNSINPSEYVQILTQLSQSLKSSSPDFFILPAGLDASAPNSKFSMSESDFINSMLDAKPDFLSYIDGWTSHSYPNPGFSGKVTDTGRGTLSNFKWEMELLKSKGQKYDFPIFITETGWAHTDEMSRISTYYPAQSISQFINDADITVWNDPGIAAITPFVLNYQAFPFSIFSWKKFGGNGFYPFYENYKALPKIAGRPEFVKVFDKFEGLDMQNLGNKNNLTDLRHAGSFFTYAFWRSLFYRIFKL